MSHLLAPILAGPSNFVKSKKILIVDKFLLSFIWRSCEAAITGQQQGESKTAPSEKIKNKS